MPFQRIDLSSARPQEQRSRIADALHQALV